MIEANETKIGAGPPEGEPGIPARSNPRERTCVGCGERSAPEEMVRLVLGPSGEIAVDAAGGGFGRGAHVHARPSCLAQAASRGLLRATKGNAKSMSVAVKEAGEVVTSEPSPFDAGALAQAIDAAMGRRIDGLLGTAQRTRKARLGADAASGAWRSGEAALIVVATDAAAAADLGEVREAIAQGHAVAWGTKERLGAVFHRDRRPDSQGIAVVAILDPGIADAVRDAVEKSMGARGVASGSPARSRRGPGGGRKSDEGRSAPARGGEDAATRTGNRGKLGAERAGRFGRQMKHGRSGPSVPPGRRATSGDLSGERRVPAQGKQAVERSE